MDVKCYSWDGDATAMHSLVYKQLVAAKSKPTTLKRTWVDSIYYTATFSLGQTFTW